MSQRSRDSGEKKEGDVVELELKERHREKGHSLKDKVSETNRIFLRCISYLALLQLPQYLGPISKRNTVLGYRFPSCNLKIASCALA